MLGFAYGRPQCIQYFAGRQESRSLLSVVSGAEMFRKIICFVTFSLFPVVPELFSVLSVTHKPIVHFRGLSRFWVEIFCYKTKSSRVVGLDWRWGLLVPHFLQQLSGGDGLAQVGIKCSYFRICCRRHDIFDNLRNVVDRAIVGGLFIIV